MEKLLFLESLFEEQLRQLQDCNSVEELEYRKNFIALYRSFLREIREMMNKITENKISLLLESLDQQQKQINYLVST